MPKFPESEYTFKIVMVGDHHVGKSCLAHRFAEGIYYENTTGTVGAGFLSRILQVEGKTVKLQIWDTAGQEQFRAIVPLYYRLANGVVIVYDTTDERSFRNVPFWVSNSRLHTDDGVEFVVLGNKRDRDAFGERRVASVAGRRAAEEAGMPFFETSAKEGTGVDAAFLSLLRAIKRRADVALEEMLAFAEPATELDKFGEDVSACC